MTKRSYARNGWRRAFSAVAFHCGALLVVLTASDSWAAESETKAQSPTIDWFWDLWEEPPILGLPALSVCSTPDIIDPLPALEGPAESTMCICVGGMGTRYVLFCPFGDGDPAEESQFQGKPQRRQ